MRPKGYLRIREKESVSKVSRVHENLRIEKGFFSPSTLPSDFRYARTFDLSLCC
jgi:hypothetical protein